MTIQLAPIAKKILSEGGKLFGSRAERVSTDDMNKIYNELEQLLGSSFSRFKLSKALPSKQDHGDIDIVIVGNGVEVGSVLKTKLGSSVADYSKNGNIHSVLYQSKLGKTVHVDFINSSPEEYDAQYDYLSYNDFSSVLGVFSRRLNFSYGTEGFFKIYKDKKGQQHYINITKNLRDGLKIIGYGKVIHKFDDIQNVDDIVDFISSSDLFDSDYLHGTDLTVSDRKRLRPSRKLAMEIKEKLIALNKHRTQPDEDYYLKTLFPEKYKELLKKAQEIENYVVPKSIYNGKWVMANFPELKPGPVIGKITQHLYQKFGDGLESTPEETVKAAVTDYLKVNSVG